LALGIAVSVAACGGGGASPGAAGGGSGAGAGDLAPALAGTTLDGQPFDLAALKGRPVVVNFWASWCIPCRDEFPLFKDALAKGTASDLAIVGVVFNDDDGAARSFLANAAADWPSVSDPNGSLARAWKVVAPPQTYFIDRGGTIRSRQIGQVTAPDLQRQLDAITR
jgi:cytochrome c biogenesis protein CcmG/thiol:disulfide interchange protein DsbE